MIINLREIKKVFISLSDRFENHVNTNSILNNLNYSNFEKFDAIKRDDYVGSGCALSHKKVLEQFMDENPLLVLEDDNQVSSWYYEYVKDGELIEIPDDCDIFYLGHSVHEGVFNQPFSCSFISEKILKLNGSLASHAIIYVSNRSKKKCIEIIDETIKNKIPLDVGYYENLRDLNVYTFSGSLFYQRGYNSFFTNCKFFKIKDEVYFNVFSEKNSNLITMTGKLK